MTKKITEADVTAMLAEKYSGREWAFCAQVPNATGLSKSRTADGLAMSLWPSKGLHLHGFEIKTNRSDWLKEIQDVSKAAAFSRFCHYWWVVAPKGVVKLEEMPAEWGYMQVGKTLRTKKAASLCKPDNPDHKLLAGIFRACSKQDANTGAIEAAYRRGRESGRKDAEKRHQHHAEVQQTVDQRMLERLQRNLAEFEEASGVKVDAWRGRKAGKELAVAQALQGMDVPKVLQDFAGRLEYMQKRVQELLNDDEVVNLTREEDTLG